MVYVQKVCQNHSSPLLRCCPLFKKIFGKKEEPYLVSRIQQPLQYPTTIPVMKYYRHPTSISKKMLIIFLLLFLFTTLGKTYAKESLHQNIKFSNFIPNQNAPAPSGSATNTQVKAAIEAFHNDMKHFEAQPKTDLTTPCIVLCRDTTYTKIWNLDDWENHTKHALFRYKKHIASWGASTTMQNIVGAVGVSGLWSLMLSRLSQKYEILQNTMAKFTVTFTFLQAPILLLLTLRTNRSLDRLLEARRAWGALGRTTRTLMGLTCAYILPRHPQAACIIARYLSTSGWVLKGMIRKQDDSEVIRSIMKSVPQEAEWLLKQSQEKGMKRPHAVTTRLRHLFSKLREEIDIPHHIMLRIEEVLYDIDATTGICNRILVSPIPPTYTRHTSRVLVLYLSLLPIALIGMGTGTIPVVATVTFASYILIGIDEIGLEIENPFPLMPLFDMSTGIQKDIFR